MKKVLVLLVLVMSCLSACIMTIDLPSGVVIEESPTRETYSGVIINDSNSPLHITLYNLRTGRVSHTLALRPNERSDTIFLMEDSYRIVTEYTSGEQHSQEIIHVDPSEPVLSGVDLYYWLIRVDSTRIRIWD